MATTEQPEPESIFDQVHAEVEFRGGANPDAYTDEDRAKAWEAYQQRNSLVNALNASDTATITAGLVSFCDHIRAQADNRPATTGASYTGTGQLQRYTAQSPECAELCSLWE